MSGNFLREISGKFSPEFSCIFRGGSTGYSPKFVFLKSKNPGNFGEISGENSGKIPGNFPRKRRKIFPEFFCIFLFKRNESALNLFFKKLKLQ